MPEVVKDAAKAPRGYSSPKREAQAAATRAKIAAAALELFVAQGYFHTTVADIAAQAEVAVPTVKLVYGTKRALLAAATDFAIKGRLDYRPVVEQEWFKAMIAAPDAREHLRLQAAGSAQVKARLTPIMEVTRAAAAADPEIAEVWTKNLGEFYDNQRGTIKALQRKGRLRPGLTEQTATDVLYALNGGTVFQQLVVELGWPLERYQHWLAEILIEQLLAPEGSEAKGKANASSSSSSSSESEP